jgi:hypothetical protein
VRTRRRRGTSRVPAEDPDFDRALEAMTAPELRALLRGVLDALDPERRAAVVDDLLARAVKGHAGWRPSRPSQHIVDDATSFAEAARVVGYADPADVSEHLRLGSKAFLAGDHASARSVFEAFLPPIAGGDIDLGQHELVDEVLGVDAHTCVAQYVTSVYTSTPLSQRADAVLSAMEQANGVGSLLNPIKEMEDVSAGALPDLSTFLPLWVKRLGRFRPSKDEWENDHERWLREAVFRLDGVEGLERLARKTKRPQACLAWCEALADGRSWAEALLAYDAAATLVGKSHWRGELLDGAALAAQQLGRADVPRRLEAAWRAAPTVRRLLRWMGSDGHSVATLRAKATKALTRCPKNAGRQCGLLRVLVGDLCGAADLLSKASGLGWSSEDHPGHLVFPLFAVLLADGTTKRVGDELLAELESTGRDPVESFFDDDAEKKPKLATPSMVALIQEVRPGIKMTDADCDVAIGAMRSAAERRVEGILGNSRRRHYGHAALLVASCLAFAPRVREAELSKWVAGLRQQYSRRYAFREELTRACVSLGVPAPA